MEALVNICHSQFWQVVINVTFLVSVLTDEITCTKANHMIKWASVSVSVSGKNCNTVADTVVGWTPWRMLRKLFGDKMPLGW
jgi:tellurite resistance protein